MKRITLSAFVGWAILGLAGIDFVLLWDLVVGPMGLLPTAAIGFAAGWIAPDFGAWLGRRR
jgi:hypothetical protein